jgi:hypothetical protein
MEDLFHDSDCDPNAFCTFLLSERCLEHEKAMLQALVAAIHQLGRKILPAQHITGQDKKREWNGREETADRRLVQTSS